MARPRLGHEQADPCLCTNPELPQFEWLSEDREIYRCVRKGKTTLRSR